MRANELIS